MVFSLFFFKNLEKLDGLISSNIVLLTENKVSTLEFDLKIEEMETWTIMKTGCHMHFQVEFHTTIE